MDVVPEVEDASSVITTNPNTSMLSSTASSSFSSTASSPATIHKVGTPLATNRSRYENQKRRDWNTFGQYIRERRPPVPLFRCSGIHVIEFLKHLDLFGKTKVHTQLCPSFGHLDSPATCPCPLRQAWGSLDALVGRLRAAYEENGGNPERNPFGARAVRLYLRQVKDDQAKARGISHEKKRRRPPTPPSSPWQTPLTPSPLPSQTQSTPPPVPSQTPSTPPPPMPSQTPSTPPPLPSETPLTPPSLSQTPSTSPPPPEADLKLGLS